VNLRCSSWQGSGVGLEPSRNPSRDTKTVRRLEQEVREHDKSSDAEGNENEHEEGHVNAVAADGASTKRRPRYSVEVGQECLYRRLRFREWGTDIGSLRLGLHVGRIAVRPSTSISVVLGHPSTSSYWLRSRLTLPTREPICPSWPTFYALGKQGGKIDTIQKQTNGDLSRLQEENERSTNVIIAQGFDPSTRV
jgi:hypothetical protein